MKYQTTVIILGVIVGVFPFIHLPTTWETILHICLALLIITSGVIIHQYRRNEKNPEGPKRSGDIHQSAKSTPAQVTSTSFEAPIERPENTQEHTPEEHTLLSNHDSEPQKESVTVKEISTSLHSSNKISVPSELTTISKPRRRVIRS